MGASSHPVRLPVSVLVCTRNRPQLLRGFLESIAPLLGPGDELIVVESGDSDASTALAGVSTEGCIVHLRSPEPGKSHKLNLAIDRASNEVLLLTDDDVVIPGQWPDAMSRPFEDPAVGAAFGPVYGLSGGEGRVIVPIGAAPLQTWAYAHGASMALRRSAALLVGGFDERLGPGAPAHGEEHDILLRIWERGYEARIADAPVVRHASWRSQEEDRDNRLVYERGAGALLGAALRRSPRRWSKYALLRLHHQWLVLRRTPDGRASARSFAGGFGYGVRLRPRRSR